MKNKKKYQEEHRIKYEYEQYVPPKPSEKKEKEEEEEEKEEEEKEEEEKKEVKVELPKVEEEKAKPIEEEKANEEKGEGEEEKKEGEVEGEAGEAKEIEDKAKEIDKVKSKAQTSKGSAEETKTDEGPNYGWDFFTRTKNETVVKKDNKFAVCPRLNKLIYKPDMLPPNKEIKSSYSYLRPKAKEDNLTFEKAIMKSKEKKVAEARNLKEISSNLKIFGEQKANFNSVKNKKYELKELIKLYNIKKDDSESTCINFPFELKTPKDEVIDYEKEKRSFNYQSKVPPFLERFSEGNKIKKVSTSFARNMNRNSNTLFKLGEEKKINLKCSLDKEECLDRLIEYQLHKGLVENHSEKCFEEIPRGQIGRLYRTRINYGELVNCNIIDAHKKEITNFVNPISFVDKDHYLSRNRSEGKPKNYMITKNFFNLNRSASSCAEFIKDNVLVDQRQNFLNLRKKLDNMKIREMNKLKHKLTSKINEMSLKNSFVSPSIQGSVCGSNLPKGFLGLLKNIEKN